MSWIIRVDIATSESAIDTLPRMEALASYGPDTIDVYVRAT